MKLKKLIGILVSMLIIITIFPVSESKSFCKNNVENHLVFKNTDIIAGDGTEYWALLIVVGEYADSPEQWTEWFREIDHMYDMLLESEWWSEDHIKVIKGRDATVSNIIQGLRWLNQMDDSDDISLVYIATHGFSLSYDIPPVDEADGFDEALVTYWGVAYPSAFLWDDELNLLLSLLDSQGVCVIVDSCHSGGFNDPPFFNRETVDNLYNHVNRDNLIVSYRVWNEGFAEEIDGNGRVVLMACREEEVSSGTEFIHYLIEGLMGFGDANLDGICSAEEAFQYMKSRVEGWQFPTIYDGYPGELPLTTVTNSQKPVYTSHWQGGNKIRELKSDKNVLGLPSPGNSTVCGYITDSSNGEPIENVKVDFWWYPTELSSQGLEIINYTDSTGFYRINVEAGFITLFFTPEEYYIDIVFFFHKIGENEILWVNRSLLRCYPEISVIRGHITDALTHEPVKNAKVIVVWNDGLQHIDWNVTNCDSLGYYLCNVAVGEISIIAERGGYHGDWTYRMDVRENETVWINHSLLPKQINLCIAEPLKALYVNDRRIMPFSLPMIIGGIDVKIDASDYWHGIDKIEFYIDEELQTIITSRPYIWRWDKMAFGKKTLKVVAYSNIGYTAVDELTLWKLL